MIRFPAPASLAALLLLATSATAGDLPEGGNVRQVGELVFDGVPEIPDRIAEKMNQYMNVRTASFVDWIPGGGLLVSTRFGEAAQLHAVARPLGARRQVTFFREPVSRAIFLEDPGWFLLMRDEGGNEASQIFRFDRRSGESARITNGAGRNSLPIASNARDRIAFRSTMRNERDHDIWIMDPTDPSSAKLVHEAKGYWYPLDWSPGDRKLVIGNYVSINESYLWILDLESGELVPFARHDEVDDETVFHGSALFDRKGEGIYFVSDEGTQFRQLRWARIGAAESRLLAPDLAWDVDELVISRDRRSLAFATNENGASALYLMNARSGKRTAADLPLGLVSDLAFSPDGDELAFTFESPAAPKDVFTLQVDSRRMTRWTESEVGGLDTAEFRTGELVHYPTFDPDESGEQRTIPAFVYKPEGEGPFPVVIWIHGGPESQSKAWFSYTTQYQLKELGIAKIYPNVRGSSGFGKSYVKLDNGFRREDSVKDIGALLDWIAEQPDLDETRVGVTGGSYGGYMVLAALTRYGDRIRAGIESVGISNFVTFLENTSDYRRDLRRAEYGDERDPAMRKFLHRISPTTNASKINVPLFVLQGANDPRVPASEAEQIVKAVRKSGNEAWYLLAKDEGHGFRKRSNRDFAAHAGTLFWERYLLNEEQRGTREKPGDVPGASR